VRRNVKTYIIIFPIDLSNAIIFERVTAERTLYGVGARLDDDPTLFFVLRDVKA